MKDTNLKLKTSLVFDLYREKIINNLGENIRYITWYSIQSSLGSVITGPCKNIENNIRDKLKQS